MQNLKTNTVIPDAITTEDYKTILKDLRLTPKDYGYYVMVGPEPTQEGQLVFISVVQSQIKELLKILAPKLAAESLTFWVVKDRDAAKRVLYGTLGYDNIGKIMMVYLPANRDTNTLWQMLVTLTSVYNGPAIPDHVPIGGLVYAAAAPGTVANPKKKIQAFNQKYLAYSTLKQDAKGDVHKGIYMKSFMQFRKCVLKEGKQFMWSDDMGKDMRDRILWQQKIHQELSPLINIPKIIDQFEDNGHTYLVMEFIKGKDLGEVIQETYNGKSWLQLAVNERIKLLDLLLEVLQIVEKIHLMGYVHRDLTSANFLLTPKGQLYIIDFELAYGTEIQYPLPVFGIGTTGFMSAEQLLGKKPTEKEDIYAIGALMTVFFTGMQPVKLDFQNKDQIRKSMLFFTDDVAIADIITRCTSGLATDRPGLEKIIQVITSSLAGQKDSDIPVLEAPTLPQNLTVKALIGSAFKGLTIPEITDNGGLFNIKAPFDVRIGYGTTIGPGVGLMCPITGILYLIHNAGPNCPKPVITFFKNYLKNYYELFLGNKQPLSPGLFYGTAGLAVAIQYGIAGGVLANTKENSAIIQDCFAQISDNPDLAYGTAGQLLAALLIYKTAPSSFLKDKLDTYTASLLKLQKNDGSWQSTVDGKQKTLKDIENGVSGILISLLKYDALFPADTTKIALEKGLNWLKKNTAPDKPVNMEKEQSLLRGSAGVALTFLYAYEHLKNAEFKNIAEKILGSFTTYAVIDDYSLGNGLLGVGFVYTEAARICNNPEWQKRAAWIYNIMANTVHEKVAGTTSWNVSHLIDSDGGLLTGNAGAILFLLRIEAMTVGS